MPGQGRLGDKANIQSDAHGCPGCPHPGLGPAISGSGDVFVNGRPALRVEDVGIHAACCGPNMWQAQQGSATVFINGKPAFRLNDPTKHCGGQGQLVEGSSDVIVGDGGGSGSNHNSGSPPSADAKPQPSAASSTNSIAAAHSTITPSAEATPPTQGDGRGPIRLPALTLIAEKPASAAQVSDARSEHTGDEKRPCKKSLLFELHDKDAGLVQVWKTEGSPAFFFKSKLFIDADGAPNAYHPPPHTERGLDYLGNAGGPGDWYGVVTGDDEEPIVQQAGPFEGFYVSPTTLSDHTRKKGDPARYIDSSTVPYISLPKHPKSQPPRHTAEPGDFAAVYYLKTKRVAYAIFAEVGPSHAIGEGSIQLADDLGLYKPGERKDARKGKGVDRAQIIYLVFPGSKHHPAWPVPVDAIRAEGLRQFNGWGGLARLMKCFPEIG